MYKYAEQNTNVKDESCNSEFHALSDRQSDDRLVRETPSYNFLPLHLYIYIYIYML